MKEKDERSTAGAALRNKRILRAIPESTEEEDCRLGGARGEPTGEGHHRNRLYIYGGENYIH